MSIWTILTFLAMASLIIGGAISFGKQQQKTDDAKEKTDEIAKEAQNLANAPHTDDDVHKRLQQRIDAD